MNNFDKVKIEQTNRKNERKLKRSDKQNETIVAGTAFANEKAPIYEVIKKWWKHFAITLLSIIGIFIIACIIIFGFYLSEAIQDSSSSLRNVQTSTLVTKLTGKIANQTNCGVPIVKGSIDGINLNSNIEKSKRFITGRILNGYAAVKHSWPWIVSIRSYFNGKIGSHFCAGSLIFDDIVLTAAHCVDRYLAKQLVVIIGINSLSEATTSSNTYYLSGIIFNSQYDKNKIIHDIAVLKLTKKATMSSQVSTICLPSSSSDTFDVFDKKLVLTGWGSITGEDSLSFLPTNLQQTVLNVKDGNEICMHSNTFDRSLVYCALDSNKNQQLLSNACFGDSGGPLIFFKNDKWYIYGIVSYILTESTKRSCDPSLPSYYTIVPQYLEFIGNAIANL